MAVTVSCMIAWYMSRVVRDSWICSYIRCKGGAAYECNSAIGWIEIDLGRAWCSRGVVGAVAPAPSAISESLVAVRDVVACP